MLAQEYKHSGIVFTLSYHRQFEVHQVFSNLNSAIHHPAHWIPERANVSWAWCWGGFKTAPWLKFVCGVLHLKSEILLEPVAMMKPIYCDSRRCFSQDIRAKENRSKIWYLSNINHNSLLMKCDKRTIWSLNKRLICLSFSFGKQPN